MKKIFLILFSLIALTSFSQEEVMFKTKGQHFNKILKQMVGCDIEMRYDIENESVMLYAEDGIGSICYMYKEAQIDSMSAIFEKYFKWEKQAVEMKVEIEKSIKQISNLTAGFTFGSGDWNIDFSSTIGASFFSQSTTNHQLVLSFEKLQSSDNEYITHNLERIYFSKEQVQEIAKGFDSGYIKSFLEKRKSQLKTHLNNSKR